MGACVAAKYLQKVLNTLFLSFVNALSFCNKRNNQRMQEKISEQTGM